MSTSIGKALKFTGRGFKPSTAIGELRRATVLPKIKKPASLQSLMQNEKTAGVFFSRLSEVLGGFVDKMLKAAAGGRPAYSNPFAGYQSRHGYGARGEHAKPHSDPFKWTARPGAKDPALSGLAEQARARRLAGEREKQRLLDQGAQSFGKSLLGGVQGAVPGAVIGGVLGSPLGPLGVAGGAALGGLGGGTIGAGMTGGGKMIGQQVMRDVGLPGTR